MATGMRVAVTPSGVTTIDLRHRVQRILGPGYELGERIGAGGFAEVFKAQDLRLKRSVAVKVLRPDLGLTPGMLDRFRREAEVVAALRHPHIVPIYDIGEGEGIAFILMPFIAGESLRAVMERSGPMDPDMVRRILTEAAHGLGAAHDAGVIHRDIKPENIMLEGREQRALLMDFGIAKAVGGEEDTPATSEGVAPTLTSTGIIVGTPQYMSPEQACGDKTIDARTDQYSLAVVGYRMLAGTLPFEGDSTRAVLYQQLVAEPTPISERVAGLPPAIAATISRAMAKEPRDRFDSMAEFAAALGAAATTSVSPALPTKPQTKTKAKPKAKPSPKPVPPSKAAPAAAGAPRQRGAAAGLSKRTRGALVLLCGVGVVAIAVGTMRLGGGGTGVNAFTPTSLFGGADSLGDSLSQVAVPPPPAPATVGSRSTGAAAPTRRTSPAPDRQTRRPAAASTSAASDSTTPDCADLASSGEWRGAVTSCTTASDQGDPVATRILASLYDEGKGVTADPARAFALYQRAAPRDAEAQFRLARMYEIGRGTTRDGRANISNLRGAAQAGHRQAMLTLAARLETGAGMDRDFDEAAQWYKRAATGGSVSAMLKLADWSHRGRGVERSDAAALDWYSQAARAGSGAGAWAAARMLLAGDGVPQDTAAGMTLLRRAAQLGQADAINELKKRGG